MCESVNRCARLTGCWGEAVDWRGAGGGGVNGAKGEGGSAVRSGHSSCIFKDLTV